MEKLDEIIRVSNTNHFGSVSDTLGHEAMHG